MQAIKRFFSAIVARIVSSKEEVQEGEIKRANSAPAEIQKKDDKAARSQVKRDTVKFVKEAEEKTQIDKSQRKAAVPRKDNVVKFQKERGSRESHKSSAEAELKASKTQKTEDPPKTRSAEDDDNFVGLADDSSSRKSLRRLKCSYERAFRRVKTFVSRPIKEATLQRFATMVEAKKQAEESGQITNRKLKRGDDVFPKPIQRSKSKDGAKEKTSDRKDVDAKSVAQAALYFGGSLPSGCKIVTGNKDNNGHLLTEDDQPFWTEQRKPTEDDLSDTDDDLQMSAEVVLDVCDGKVKLVNMPSISVVLDPMNELAELKRRDSLFFTREILFGNSVRSMINIHDNSTKVTPIIRKRKTNGTVSFKEPSVRYSYYRSRPTVLEPSPFTPGERPSYRSVKRKKRSKIAAKIARNLKIGSHEGDDKKENQADGKNEDSDLILEKTQD
ncbi:hypothetical protein Q1695_002974 [Nippostrongylus brasiliensis]|nr:hypothetical protein Q1695_002974 [Nippostrongylus brasiliensis]